jgi:hypothetical protein
VGRTLLSAAFDLDLCRRVIRCDPGDQAPYKEDARKLMKSTSKAVNNSVRPRLTYLISITARPSGGSVTLSSPPFNS